MNCACQCFCGKKETLPTRENYPLTVEICNAWLNDENDVEIWSTNLSRWTNANPKLLSKYDLYRIKPPKRTPHVHANVIKAYAEGYKIEGRHPLETEWVSTEEPKFYNDIQYRVAPGQI